MIDIEEPIKTIDQDFLGTFDFNVPITFEQTATRLLGKIGCQMRL